MVFGVLKLISDFPEPPAKVGKTRSIGAAPVVSATMGFFDGEAQTGIGGAGMILYISWNHFFHMPMGCGRCSNMKAELLALWGLLHVASTIGLPRLTLLGDSKVLIEWVQSIARLHVSDLEQWGTSLTLLFTRDYH